MSISGFTVYVSNRLEILVKQLARDVQTPLGAPLDPEIIVVQSQGMARWVSMQLAERNRICANTAFPFPNALLSYLGRNLLPDLQQDRLFESDALTFRIMAVLPERLHEPRYRPLQSYLADDPQGVKQYQLAAKIADLFDQYLIFRTDMVSDWDRAIDQADADQAWQADLWRAVTTSSERLHRAEMQKRLLEALIAADVASGVLPARISAFGISHLPRFHIEIMAAVSRHIPVQLYVMNPCQEYWGEIVTRRDVRRIRSRYAQRGVAAKDLHLDKGNPILAATGSLGRDFLSMVSELECLEVELFERLDGRSMLSQIQADILELHAPAAVPPADVEPDAAAPAGPGSKGEPIFADDNSLRIHACHSPMREVEVLFDQILEMLQTRSDLMPRDILVMLPDIEAYTPYISAVFGTVDDERMRVPYSIADRSALKSSPVIEGFLAVLDLATSRMEAGRVLDIIAYDAISEKFGLDDGERSRIAEWVRELNVRWGKDARDRSRIALPPESENTWQSGLERMLLGLAMAGGNQKLFAGILPYDNLEGADTVILGKLLDFVERLFQICRDLEEPRQMSAWCPTLAAILECMFSRSDATVRDLQKLQSAIDTMRTDAAVAEYDSKLDLAVVKSHLRGVLGAQTGGSGFILGGVTFCAMLPMRSIPFNVICLLGMNADAFPRESKTVSFDLMASHPRKGDRSRREDDKYLFLEAVMSARDKLYISYIGQNIQDNSHVMPSVLVSQLVDYIHDRFGVEPAELVQFHPLQAFSPVYFSVDSPFFSYSRENFAAVAPQQTVDRETGRSPGVISTPADEWQRVDVASLCRFFAHPARFLIQERLGVTLEEPVHFPDDHENFRIAALDAYWLAEELVRYHAEGGQPEALKPAVQARGILPHGAIGDLEFKRLCGRVRHFAGKLQTIAQGRQPSKLPVSFTVGRFRLHGVLPGIYDEACVHARYTRFNPGDVIRLWIYHLIRSTVEPGSAVKSWYVARDATVKLTPPRDSESILRSLLDIYWDGLSGPMRFFPFASYTYAKKVVRQAVNTEDARQAVQNTWLNDFGWSEADDPYVSLCFKNENPLDDRFEDLAISIFKPILENFSELKG